MPQSRSSLDPAIDQYQALIQRTPQLRAEFESSLEQFFRAGIPAASNPLESLASSRRYLEWFVFERHSASLRTRPAEGLLELWQESYPDGDSELEASLLESFSGLFEVTVVQAGVGAQVVDLSGLQSYDLAVPDDQFQVGDLLVGRLYPIGEQAYEPSSACASFRDEQLLAAVKNDVELVRNTRERKVFRIAQGELESMFFDGSGRNKTAKQTGADAADELAGAVQAAREWLTGGGLAPDAVESVLADLREHAPDADNVHPGRDDALGYWLDELAFTGSLDLDEARTRLLAAWTELHAPKREAEATHDQDVDVDGALAEFERDCAGGKAVVTALGELENRLALDTEETGDIGTVPDFPGVVGAMVEEFLWEEEQQFGHESVQGFEVLHAFSSYTKNLGVFEELGHKDVSDFVTRWIPEHPKVCTTAQVPALLKALDKFCTWALETQGALGLTNSNTLIIELHGTLERITRINKAIDRAGTGELFQVIGIDAEYVSVSHVETGDQARLALSEALRELQSDDYLRVSTEAETPVAVRIYPPQLGSLLKDLVG